MCLNNFSEKSILLKVKELSNIKIIEEEEKLNFDEIYGEYEVFKLNE